MTDTIRRAIPEDAETVRMLVIELADHQDEGEHVRGTAERWREMLGRDDVIVLLAERDGVPAGYVSALQPAPSVDRRRRPRARRSLCP